MLIFETIPNYDTITKDELIDYMIDNNHKEFMLVYGSLVYDISDIDDDLIIYVKKIISEYK